MKKRIMICIICFVLLLICCLSLYFLFGNKDLSLRKTNSNIHILASIDDKVENNSIRCGTFQLIWNDMINQVVKRDVEFSPQLEIVENLNMQTFSSKDISSSSYYSKFGLLTLDLKEEIETQVKKRFNVSSNILEQGSDWSNVPQSDDYYDGKSEKKYGFYAMLMKIFNFEKMFDELDTGKFANEYDNVKYFGIKGSSSDELYDQVYVYYYNSDDDFAVALESKEGESVVLSRGAEGNSFVDIYNDILNSEQEYEGKHYFTEDDSLKVPELELRNVNEFYELEDKEFYTNDGSISKIGKALQAIEVKLNKEGGKIESEAWIEMDGEMFDGSSFDETEYRYFYFDNPYVMFLKEEDKKLPYFAAQISDITLFQN